MPTRSLRTSRIVTPSRLSRHATSTFRLDIRRNIVRQAESLPCDVADDPATNWWWIQQVCFCLVWFFFWIIDFQNGWISLSLSLSLSLQPACQPRREKNKEVEEERKKKKEDERRMEKNREKREKEREGRTTVKKKGIYIFIYLFIFQRWKKKREKDFSNFLHRRFPLSLQFFLFLFLSFSLSFSLLRPTIINSENVKHELC